MSTAPRRVSNRLILSLVAAAVAQVACSLLGQAPATPSAEISPIPETTSAEGPSPLLTAAPTESPAATLAVLNLPDRPLDPSGPWYAFASDDALWALNADGSGLTMLWDIYGEGLNIDELVLWPAPRGGRVAIVQIDKRFDQTAPVLKLLELPSGSIRTVADLLPGGVQSLALDLDARDAADQVWAAVGLRNQLAWSSDGRMLAFNAAIDGPSADVYVYNTITSKIVRLTDGPDQSVDLAWSPDDGYVVHGVAESLYYGYSGLGYGMLGAWAASPDPAKTPIHLFDHAFLGYEEILGWLDDSRYLADSLDGESLGNCGSFDLRAVDIQEGEGPILLDGHYTWRAFDPETRTLLLVLTSTLQEFKCSTSLAAGVYLFDVDRQQARLLSGVAPDSIMSANWSREASLFFLGGGSELIGVDPGGTVSRYPSPEDLWDSAPVVGPRGDVWALSFASLPTRLAIGTQAGDLIEIDIQDTDHPFWSLDGEWLFFSDILNLYAAPSPDFEPAIVVGEMLSPRAPVLVNP